VEWEEEILPGLSVFWIGGHSPADQAVSARTLSGNTVITSDTVFLYRNIEENVPVGYFYNLEECYDAMETIRNVADVILPTHDPEVLVRHPEGV
jgi:glyoxylase-like metal-dependent hydrolase (beta-lactamase superfamily II)